MSDADPKSDQEKIAELTAKVDSVEKTLQGFQKLTEDGRAQAILDSHAALLEDANSWAQHFSTVRSGVTTFLLTVALGIMQFQWEKPTWVAFVGAIACWIVAGALLWFFTSQQVRKLNQIGKNKELFLTLTGQLGRKSDKYSWYTDVPFLAYGAVTVLFLATLFWWHPHPDPSDRREFRREHRERGRPW